MSDIIFGIERNISTKGPTINVGDFNYPEVIWNTGSIPTDASFLQLYNCVISNDLVQVVQEPTRGDNIIDLLINHV